jgi:hypothetical protein
VGSTTQSVLLYVSNDGTQSMSNGGSAVYYPLGASYGGYSMSGAGGTVSAGSAATLTFNYSDLASHYRYTSSSLSFTFTSGGSTYRMIATAATARPGRWSKSIPNRFLAAMPPRKHRGIVLAGTIPFFYAGMERLA